MKKVLTYNNFFIYKYRLILIFAFYFYFGFGLILYLIKSRVIFNVFYLFIYLFIYLDFINGIKSSMLSSLSLDEGETGRGCPPPCIEPSG